MNARENYIKAALEKDVDLSAEEYREKCRKADASTAVHGVEGKAPVSEAVRSKRIQSNFYGTSLNVMLSVLAELNQTNALLSELLNMIYVGMTEEGRATYKKMMEQKEGDNAGK